MLKIYSSDKQQLIQYLHMCWKCVEQIIHQTDFSLLEELVKDLELFQQFFDSQYQILQNELNFEKLLSQILTIMIKIKDFANRKFTLLVYDNDNMVDHLQQSIAQSLAQEDQFKKQGIPGSIQSQKNNPFSNTSPQPQNTTEIHVLKERSINQSRQFEKSQQQSKTSQNLLINKNINQMLNESLNRRPQFDSQLARVSQQSFDPKSQNYNSEQIVCNLNKANYISTGEKQDFRNIANSKMSHLNQVIEESYQCIEVDQSFVSNRTNTKNEDNRFFEENNCIYRSPVRIVKSHEKVPNIDQYLQSPAVMNDAEKKIKFFRLAAQMKENYPGSYSVKNVLVSGLYDRAKNSNIQPDEYQQFIFDYYSNL